MIDSLKMLEIQGSILHGKVINNLIKLYMGVQLSSVCINIIVEHILGGTWIIPKEDYFGDMIFKLGFSLSRESHINNNIKCSKGRRGYLAWI